MDEQPNDGIKFLNAALFWLGAVAMVLFTGIAVTLIFSLEKPNPATVAAPPEVPYLTNPIECDARVNGRCYVATSTKAELAQEGK